MSKATKKQKIESTSVRPILRLPAPRGIIGTWKLLVVSSIAASAVIIYTGTDDILAKIIIAPMSLYAVAVLVLTFSNANKETK